MKEEERDHMRMGRRADRRGGGGRAGRPQGAPSRGPLGQNGNRILLLVFLPPPRVCVCLFFFLPPKLAGAPWRAIQLSWAS
eukprot:4846634-Pyramimonas_sp.AAC.1